jgi:transcriptional regulator with XRE-family HTH domain
MVKKMAKSLPPNNELGGRIKKARKRAGLTMTQLSKMIGVNQSSISRFEAGTSGVAVETLRKIAAATQTEVFALIGEQPGTEYKAVTMPMTATAAGVECPWEQTEVPVYWPGTMREFVGSAQAELAQLGPDEVAGLAQAAMFLGVPVEEAGWMRLLAWVRMFKGARGRPVYLEMREVEGEEE